MKKKDTCDSCGTEFDAEQEGYWAEGHAKDVCRDCYDDIVKTCQLCGDDDVMPSAVSEFIVVKRELAGSRRIPGIFRIQRRPFLSIPLIGAGHLHTDDVLFIDRLPRPDRTFEISGHICHKCAPPYRRTYRRIYARIAARKKRGAYWRKPDPLWVRECRHTAFVAAAHPEMLRDLNTDTEYELAPLRKLFCLSVFAPTWHEPPMLVEHRGVKVWCCYRRDAGWSTLRPEPRHRNPSCRSEFVFDAASLPSFDMEAAMGRSTYDDRTGDLEREAVIAAIDLGALTQTRIAPHNSPIWQPAIAALATRQQTRLARLHDLESRSLANLTDPELEERNRLCHLIDKPKVYRWQLPELVCAIPVNQHETIQSR